MYSTVLLTVRFILFEFIYVLLMVSFGSAYRNFMGLIKACPHGPLSTIYERLPYTKERLFCNSYDTIETNQFREPAVLTR